MKISEIVFTLSLLTVPATALASDTDLLSLQHSWAKTTYQTQDETARLNELNALTTKLQEHVDANPDDARYLTWLAIVQASTAKAKGGLGALDHAEAAKENFEKALQIDEQVLHGTALTSLAALYHKVPGWPVSFGDDDEAESLFKRALEVNPQGIDVNFFYAEFLFDDGDYQQARHYLEKASQAAPRPDRPLADEGRHNAIDALKTKVDKKLG